MLSHSQIIDFESLQDVLLRWPDVDLDLSNWALETAQKPAISRVGQILKASLENHGALSLPDLAPLLRQLLLGRGDAVAQPQLRVPLGNGWPDLGEWKCFGLRALAIEGDVLLSPMPWRPDWLRLWSDGDQDVFADTFSGKFVRQPAEAPMDPFLREASGYEYYLSPAQREAVRSVLFMPAGSTLIVNLPTGSGKTMVGQAPVLVRGLRQGLTLFVVPTTALAIDQERRLRELMSHKLGENNIPPLAWYSGLNDESRRAIRANIRDGTQGILFTSPEGATGPLLSSLYDAAVRGLLNYLIVDEAHLIAQWGDSFRPAFQTLAGVRRGLLRAYGGEMLRTVLMSATLDPETVSTLDVLFGPREQVQMVSGVHLRPEPRYWSHKARSREEKKQRVLELLRYVPRPYLLYVTERGDADIWLEILRCNGYQRVASFHGNTPDSTRERVIADWTADRLDGIVATSAFGVGMDKSDIRAVIHAAIPETLDRYYQEVGRGGRDGRASISVVIYDERDIGIARSLGKPMTIGDGNAFARWDTMYETAKPVGNEIIAVDITSTPAHVSQQTDYNNDWNVRTLILMARSGMIELDSVMPVPPSALDEESEAAYEQRTRAYWEDYHRRISIRTLDPGHRSHANFDRRIAAERQRALQTAEHSFYGLMDAIEGRQEMSAVLSALYESKVHGRDVPVSPACRGCPGEKPEHHEPARTYQIPLGVGVGRIVQPDISLWRRQFPGLTGQPAVILYPPTSEKGLTTDINRALSILVSGYGVRELSTAAEQWDASRSLSQLHSFAQDRVLIARTLDEDRHVVSGLPLPRVTLLYPWGQSAIPDYLFLLDRPLHIIFAPEDIVGDHPLRQFRDTATNCILLEDFLNMASI